MSVNKYDKDTQTLTKVAGYEKFPRWTGTKTEWELQNKADIIDGTIVTITDDSDAITYNQKYKKTEVNTGATWVDGRPIYRKTYTSDKITNGTVIDSTITSDNTELIHQFGNITINSSSYNFPFGNNNGSSYVTLKTTGLVLSSSWTILNVIITIEYVKK